MAVETPKTAKDIAKSRVAEAELVAEAFVIQTRKRELDLASHPTFENYHRVSEARAQLAAAKRHLKHAVKEDRECR